MPRLGDTLGSILMNPDKKALNKMALKILEFQVSVEMEWILP